MIVALSVIKKHSQVLNLQATGDLTQVSLCFGRKMTLMKRDQKSGLKGQQHKKTQSLNLYLPQKTAWYQIYLELITRLQYGALVAVQIPLEHLLKTMDGT